MQAVCTAVSLLACVPLGELFFFHMILIRKVDCLWICLSIMSWTLKYLRQFSSFKILLKNAWSSGAYIKEDIEFGRSAVARLIIRSYLKS